MQVKPQHIILAGAGPGDPELITLKLANALRDAEIIIVDRLVNPEIIRRHASKNVKVISVGKQGYNKNSTPQEDINGILIQSAQTGKKTIRLKGGDVAIYSNVLSEIEALYKHDISFEIIPGITAASGAAASMNIPLTGRDLAAGLQIHTLSASGNIGSEQLMSWAKTQDTLVFYMSILPLKTLVDGLLTHQADPELPVVIIEEATTPAQKIFRFNLGNLQQTIEQVSFKTPALVMIGRILSAMDPGDLHTNDFTSSVFNTLIPPTINTDLHVI